MPEQQQPAKETQKKKNPDRRRQLWSFLGILFSFMLLLSLVSYTPADQANGQVRIVDPVSYTHLTLPTNREV